MRRWTGFCNSCCTVPRLSKVVTCECDSQQQAHEILLVLRCIAHRSRGRLRNHHSSRVCTSELVQASSTV